MPNPIPQATQKQRQWDAASPVGAAYFADVAPTELEIIFDQIFYNDGTATVLGVDGNAAPP